MQELLQWVRSTMPMDLDLPIMLENKIESFIPKEREIIRSAYMDGQDDFYVHHNIEIQSHLNSLHYYNKKFKK